MISPSRCVGFKDSLGPNLRSSLEMPCPGAHDHPWPTGCASRGGKRPTDRFSQSLGTTRRGSVDVFLWVQKWQPKKSGVEETRHELY